MQTLSVCRVCLSRDTKKDISNLKSQQKNKSSTEIFMFCLSIQVAADSKVSTKLCLKCFRKIIAFCEFKTLALKNDAYLKNLANSHLKSDNVNVLKYEEQTNETFVEEVVKIEGQTDISTSILVKLEPDLGGYQTESEDELLSDIKKIKYEFITEETDSKENEHIKTRKENSIKRNKTKHDVCESCGVTVKDLGAHTECHKPENSVKRVPCKLCDKTFSSHSSKYKHIQRIHVGVKKPCPICRKEVKDLNCHNLRVHNPTKLRHSCAHCGKRFISASSRDDHALTHTKQRPHPCDRCDKRFRQLTTLLQHKQQIHDKVPAHLCQYCSKSFFSIKYLQRHLLIHSTDRAYQCKKCGKAFKTPNALKNHTYTHAEERSYHCTQCGMKFTHPGYLRAHILTHTKEKRYPCKYCDVKFHRSDHRKRHEFTAHEKHLSSK